MRTETFQTPGPVRLDVRLGSGEVRLETSDTAETTVTLEPLRDNDASMAAVQEARVEQPQADRGLERDDEPACGVRRGVVTQLRDRREVGLERIDEAL